MHCIMMPDQQWAEIQVAARTKGISASDLIRRVMDAYIAGAVSHRLAPKSRQFVSVPAKGRPRGIAAKQRQATSSGGKGSRLLMVKIPQAMKGLARDIAAKDAPSAK